MTRRIKKVKKGSEPEEKGVVLPQRDFYSVSAPMNPGVSEVPSNSGITNYLGNSFRMAREDRAKKFE